MDNIASIINTILLIILFCYQRNKNKVLADRIDNQTKLISETKSVVTQQATAIESQGKVVETAIRYTEAFNPDKLEAILKRQFEQENADKIAKIEKQYHNQLAAKEKAYEELISSIVDSATKAILTELTPLLVFTMRMMFMCPVDLRRNLISSIGDGEIKTLLIGASQKIDTEIAKRTGK